MCTRYALYADPALIGREFRLRSIPDFALSFNIAPGQAAPVVRRRENRSELVSLRWGLVPPWSRGPEAHISLFNARSDALLTKPAYREAFRRRRCLVPVSGYYAWRENDDSSAPYYLCGQGEPFLALAGLWEHWQNADRTLESFTIIITSARGPARNIAEQMPVILFRENWDRWLSTPAEQVEELLPLLVAGEKPLRITKVTDDVNDPSKDGPELIEPISSH